jgi:hypothetical protein
MSDADRRRELRDDHRQRQRVAAVYRLCVADEVALLGSTTDLVALENRLAFARATGTAGALDLRVRQAIARHGMDAVRLEVLDTIQPGPTTTPQELAADVSALEELWRQQGQATTLA